jgi:exopolyphosphatase/guanosine-5'-triphosphate,3'-diphosphate pyrophosphatase
MQTDNKIGVIDVGSNSVRLMMSECGKTLYKHTKTTRLADGLCDAGLLGLVAIERTADAVCQFNSLAKEEGATKVYAFATAAVRQAKNGNEFTDMVKRLCGIEIEVIDGKTEAELGVKGALNGSDGGIIDVGGASSEVIVVKNGKTEYCKSLDVGAVRLFNACGQSEDAVVKTVSEKVKEYGKVPKSNFYAIGGTATTLASVVMELEPYDPEKVHGYILTKNTVFNLAKRLFSMSIEDRRKLKGLQPERAEVIAGGAMLVYAVMDYLDIQSVTVSENDNLEGYLILKGELNE